MTNPFQWFINRQIVRIGRTPTLGKIQRQLDLLASKKLARNIAPMPDDDAAAALLKAIDISNIQFVAHCLNWILGRTTEPPVTFLLETIKGRKKKKQTDLRLALQQKLSENAIGRDFLVGLMPVVGKKCDCPCKHKQSKSMGEDELQNQPPADGEGEGAANGENTDNGENTEGGEGTDTGSEGGEGTGE